MREERLQKNAKPKATECLLQSKIKLHLCETEHSQFKYSWSILYALLCTLVGYTVYLYLFLVQSITKVYHCSAFHKTV